MRSPPETIGSYPSRSKAIGPITWRFRDAALSYRKRSRSSVSPMPSRADRRCRAGQKIQQPGHIGITGHKADLCSLRCPLAPKGIDQPEQPVLHWISDDAGRGVRTLPSSCWIARKRTPVRGAAVGEIENATSSAGIAPTNHLTPDDPSLG
jgi:hypothetical protein